MKVWKVDALDITVVFDEIEDAIDEVRMHVENDVDVFVFSDEMTEEEYEALQENEGLATVEPKSGEI